MNDAKYIGLDVHQATIAVAGFDSVGKLVMEAILETKATTILQCRADANALAERVNRIAPILPRDIFRGLKQRESCCSVRLGQVASGNRRPAWR